MHAAPGARVLSIYHMLWAPLAMVSARNRVPSIYHMRWAPLAMVAARNRVPSIYHMRWAPITRFFDAHSDQKLCDFFKKKKHEKIK